MELHLDQLPDPLDVLSFESRERMNGSYSVDVRVNATAAPSDLASRALEKKAVLLVPGDASPRTFDGVVSRVRHEAPDVQGKRPLLIRLEPTARRLSRGSMRQIFQELSAVAVVTRVLAARGIAHRLALRGAYAVRPYCTQYDESDWDFVTRLLADEGISWWWEHPVAGPPGSEVLVLEDCAAPRLDVDGGSAFAYREAEGSAGMAPREADVTRFEVWTRARARAALRQGYDLSRPLRSLVDARVSLVVPEPPTEPDGSAGMRGAIDPALLASAEVAAQTLVEPLLDVERKVAGDAAPGSATVRLEQARSDVRVAEGETLSLRLAPGRRLELSDHPDPDANRSWTVTEVRAEGFSPSALPAGRAHRIRATFACVPAEVRFRPRAPERALRQVAETALVVGPAGQELHTDELGRVKVRFHWDASAQEDDRASCWMRVTQLWAGAGWGAMFLPRVGMEVLVTFLGGDVDRPVVTGCLYNGTHPVPWKLPEDKALSGIRSSSTPGGGGGSELIFGDQQQGESLGLRTSGAMSVSASGHRTTHVGGTDTLSVGGDRAVAIAGRETLSVGGDRAVHIAGDLELQGAGHVGVGARDVNARISEALDVAAGSATLRVGGDYRVFVGADGGLAHASLTSSGTLRVASARELVIHSATSVTLSCGESTLTLLPDRIELRSRKAVLRADQAVQLQVAEAEFVVADTISGKAAVIELTGEKARLRLEKDARLGGEQVQLCSSGAKAVAKAVDPKNPGFVTFRIDRALLGGDEPLVAVVAMPDGEAREHEVPADGILRIPGNQGEHFEILDLRRGARSLTRRGGS